MPRGFNEQEKQKIFETLIDEGKRLFSRFGLKKTSVGELAKAAGIAPGSFYTFFDSKEALFFEIMEKEEDKIRSRFIQLDLTREADIKESLKRFLFQMLSMVEENELFRQLLLDKNYDALLRKLPPQKLEEHLHRDSDSIGVILSKWKEIGIAQGIEEDAIAGLFRALFTISLHKQEVGEEIYPKTMELLMDLIVEGLIKKGE
ncbi:TetR/AcrR family transcriptional regulator [Niallia sp. JL1B1071]|uniref:TetR/AcrR family transcriptional regulator n=1 Tax=Niallia tiangongensis TaxID=3237105 RepID=UPI0037DDBF8F